MNQRIQKLAEQAGYTTDMFGVGHWDMPECQKFAELIIDDVMNELFVVYPGGKNGSDVKFQNITARQWINQVFGVER